MAECLYCAVGNHRLCERHAFVGHGMNAREVRCSCLRRGHKAPNAGGAVMIECGICGKLVSLTSLASHVKREHKRKKPSTSVSQNIQ